MDNENLPTDPIENLDEAILNSLPDQSREVKEYDPKNREVTAVFKDGTITISKTAIGVSREFTSEQYEEANQYFQFLIVCSHN